MGKLPDLLQFKTGLPIVKQRAWPEVEPSCQPCNALQKNRGGWVWRGGMYQSNGTWSKPLTTVALHEIIQLLEHHNRCKSKWGGRPENILTLKSFLTVNAGRVYRSLVSPLSGLCSSPPCLQSLQGWDHVCEKQPQLWSPAPVLSGEEKPWVFRTIQPLWNYWKPSAKTQMTVSHRYKPDVGIPRLRSSKPQPSYAHPHPAWRWQPGEKGHAAGIVLLQQMTCLSSSSVHITRTMTTRKDGGMSCQELRPL